MDNTMSIIVSLCILGISFSSFAFANSLRKKEIEVLKNQLSDILSDPNVYNRARKTFNGKV